MNNIEDQLHSPSPDSRGRLRPDYRYWGNSANNFLFSYTEQPQSSFAYPHAPWMSLPDTIQQSTASTGLLSCGGLDNPTATGTKDFARGTCSNVGLCQPQWDDVAVTPAYATHTSVLQLDQQTPLAWSHTFEPSHVLGIPSMPGPQSQVEQVDAWMDDDMHRMLNQSADSMHGSCSSWDASFSEGSDTADFGIPWGTHASPWSPMAPTHSSITSAKPAPSWNTSTSGLGSFGVGASQCRWVTDGALCGAPVLADRRHIAEHVQLTHGIHLGEEKARQTCTWDECGTELYKESLVRHILTIHLKKGVQCPECGLSFAREDSVKRHLKGSQHNGTHGRSAAKQPSRTYAGF